MLRLTKSFAVPFAEVIARGISLIVILGITRLLSKEDYGAFSYVNSIVLVFSIFFDSGINNKVFVDSLNNKLGKVSAYLGVKLFISVTSLFLLSIYAIITKMNYQSFVVLFGIHTMMVSVIYLFKFLVRGRGLTNMDVLLILLEPILRLVLFAVVYFLTPFQLLYVYIIYGFSAFLSFIIAFAVINRMVLRINLNAGDLGINRIGKLLGESKQFIIYYFLFILSQRLEIFVIENRLNLGDLGIYFSAFNVFIVFQLAFRSLVTSRFSRWKDSKRPAKLLAEILILSSILIIIVQFFSPVIYKWIFPLEYMQGEGVLKILVISIPLYAINIYFINFFNYKFKVLVNIVVFAIILFSKLSFYYFFKIIDLQYIALIVVCSEFFILLAFLIPYKSLLNK